MSDKAFFIYWSICVSVFLFGMFLPVEVWAAYKNPNVDTLSAWVWSITGRHKGWNWWTTPVRLGMLAGFVILGTHLALGWP